MHVQVEFPCTAGIGIGPSMDEAEFKRRYGAKRGRNVAFFIRNVDIIVAV